MLPTVDAPMPQASQRAFLVAEKVTLEGLISTLHPESILERMGLEARLCHVTEELAFLDAHAQVPLPGR